MSYVIMNTENERLWKDKSYGTLRATKMVCTKLNIAADHEVWVAISQEEFEENHDPMVESTNMMSGKTIMIRKSLKGTCCDPSTETYWSM